MGYNKGFKEIIAFLIYLIAFMMINKPLLDTIVIAILFAVGNVIQDN